MIISNLRPQSVTGIKGTSKCKRHHSGNWPKKYKRQHQNKWQLWVLNKAKLKASQAKSKQYRLFLKRSGEYRSSAMPTQALKPSSQDSRENLLFKSIIIQDTMKIRINYKDFSQSCLLTCYSNRNLTMCQILKASSRNKKKVKTTKIRR